MECGHQKKSPKQPNGGTTTLFDIEKSEFGYNNEQMQPKNWSKSDKNKETNLNFLEKKMEGTQKANHQKQAKHPKKNETLKEPELQSLRSRKII